MMPSLFLLIFTAVIFAIMGRETISTGLGFVALVLCLAWLNFHASDTLSILL
jgi:hypothetical protein